MVLRKIILFALITISETAFCNNASEIIIPKTVLIDKLIQSGKSADIYIPLSFNIDAINRPLHVAFLKNKETLYLKLDGTGYVYQYDTTIANNCHFKRIDKTNFIGYNFGEFPFFHKDTLYSLGGYGYWVTNGNLRKYSFRNGEWNIKPIAQHIFSNLNSTITYKRESNEVFVYSTYIDDEGLKNYNRKNRTLYKLSITSGDVDTVGTVDKYLDNILADYPIKLNTSLGSLFLDAKSPVLLCDFEKNLVQEITDIDVYRLYVSDNAQWLPFILEDSTIFFEKEGKLDSIILNAKKFIRTKNILYQPFDKKNTRAIYYLFFSILAIGTTYIIWRLNKNKNLNEAATQENISDDALLFDTKELAILKKLYLASSNNKGTSTDELNTLLGIDKKGLEVQKKQRSTFLNHINGKAKDVLNIQTDLIIREKDETDKRVMLYKIDPNLINKIKQVLQ